MSESGTTVINSKVVNTILGIGKDRGSISLKTSNTLNNVNISAHNNINTSYKITLPQAIGSVDEVLKIDSVVGSEAICSWGSGGGGGSGIVNNRIDGDLTIGDDESDLLVVNSDAKFVNNLQLPSIITLNTNSIISIGGPVSTTATAASTYNIALGFMALQSLTTGSHNIAVGFMASKYLRTGSNNIAIGNESQWGAVVGSNNVAMGLKSLMGNIYGSQNIAIGVEALTTNISGGNNIAIGEKSLYGNTSGYSNVATGVESLFTNLNGGYNVATGYRALYSNTSGNNNVAIGTASLDSNTTGYQNVATGAQSLYLNTTGNNNVARGYQSLKSNTSGNYNIATGTYALYSNTTGIYNVAIGSISLYLNTTGSNNVAMGYQALFSTTGTGNTGIGYKAGYSITSGSYNVCIGYDSDVPTATGDKQLAISTSGLPNSIPWISGNSSGNVGIGTITPTAKLDVTGNTNISGNVNLKGDVVIGEDDSDLLVVNSDAKFVNNVNIGTDENIMINNISRAIPVKPVSGDAGKVLKANAAGTGLEYGTISGDKLIINQEITTPSQPSDGTGYLYSKAGGLPYWRSYDINETALIENGRQFSFNATNGGNNYHFNGGTSNTYYQFPNADSTSNIDFTFTIGILENSSQFFNVDTCEYTVPMDGNYTFGWTTQKLGHSSGSRLVIRRKRGSAYTDLVDSGYSTTGSVRYTSVSNTSLLRNDIVSFWVKGPNSSSGGQETGLGIVKATSVSSSVQTIIHGYKN